MFRHELVRPISSRARTVLLATGAQYRRLPVDDLSDYEGMSVFYAAGPPEAQLCGASRVGVVGGGNSAAESALEMFRAGAHVTVVHRAPTLKSTIKYWVRPDIENRIKEGSIAARFGACVTAIRPTAIVLNGPNGEEELAADAVYLLTGYRADADLLCRAGVAPCSTRAPACPEPCG